MPAGVQPGVERDRAFDAAQPADRVAKEEGRVDEVLLARLGGVPARCDQELVGGAAGRRGERDDVSSERDLEALFAQDVADAAPALFEPGSSSGTAGGGSRSQTSCEWLCGRLAPASRPSLSTTWTYANPRPRAAWRRASRAVATASTSVSSSSASERTCRGVWTTTSWRSNAG